jgi:hypothetical protein
MGKTITRVGTSVTRVIEDDNMPDAVRNGLIKALFSDGELVDYILDEMTTSLSVRADKMYEYAEETYQFGLPSGDVFASTQGIAQVEQVIETLEGQQVVIEYSHYGPMNAQHVGYMKLISQYGYNPATNELPVLSQEIGFPVYLTDMKIVVPAAIADSVDTRVLERWGPAPNSGYTPVRPAVNTVLSRMVQPTPIVRSNTATNIELKAEVIWAVPFIENNFVYGFQDRTLTTTEYSDTANFFHVKYNVNGQTKYWLYQDDTGVYPALDEVFADTPVVSGSYFPFVYFRYNKQSTNVNPTSSLYLQSKKMCKLLGMDFETVADAINDNPDIADVEQAMLMFAVPPVSTEPIENKYLFDYFQTLYTSVGPVSVLDTYNYSYETSTQYTIVIKDGRFKKALGYDGIIKRLKPGTVGEIDTYTSEKGSEIIPYEYLDNEGTIIQSSYTIPVYFYRRQIAPGLLEEIEVRNLKMLYFVLNQYFTTSDVTEDILLVPLDRSITVNYATTDRERLYARAMHMVFNSAVVQKIKWYQTGIFQAVMLIVAIVVTVLSWGTTSAAVGGLLNLTGAAAVVATIVVQLIIGQLITIALGFVARKLGAEVTIALAVLALIYGGYQVFKAGALNGTWAAELLQISNGLQKASLEVKMEELLQDQAELQVLIDEGDKLLEDANKLLESNSILEPWMVFGESPDDYYNRTVHFGNIGTLGISAVSSFVDVALTLPKLNDTLGENPNELV